MTADMDGFEIENGCVELIPLKELVDLFLIRIHLVSKQTESHSKQKRKTSQFKPIKNIACWYQNSIARLVSRALNTQLSYHVVSAQTLVLLVASFYCAVAISRASINERSGRCIRVKLLRSTELRNGNVICNIKKN